MEEQTSSRAVQLRAAFAVIAFLLAGIGIHGLPGGSKQPTTPVVVGCQFNQ